MELRRVIKGALRMPASVVVVGRLVVVIRVAIEALTGSGAASRWA